MFQWLSKSKRKNVLLLDKEGIVNEGSFVEGKIDIVLTPSFYWFVKKKLPVKFNFQVKEYLPSIFEEFTNTDDLSYYVIKKNDLSWLFAYDDKVILESLKKNGIDISDVDKIYFAQNVFVEDSAVDLKNGYILVGIDGVISRIPADFVEKDSITLSDALKDKVSFKDGVVLKKYASIVDEKIVKKIMIPLFLIVFVEATEALKVWRENKNLENSGSKIFSKYSLPPTSFQNQAILSSLKKKNLEQEKIRELANILFKAPFLKGEYIAKLNISKNRANIKIKLLNNLRAKKFKNYLLKFSDLITIKKIVVKNSVADIRISI